MDTTTNLHDIAVKNMRAENAKIRRRLKVHGGYSPAVARELGVQRRRVEKVRKAAGIELDRSRWPGRGIRYTPELIEAGLAEYARIGTIKGTVRATGVPEGTLRRWIKREAKCSAQ